MILVLASWALTSLASASWWPFLGIWLGQCDALVARCLFPLAVIILISGLDDLALDAIYLWSWLWRRLPAIPRHIRIGGEKH